MRNLGRIAAVAASSCLLAAVLAQTAQNEVGVNRCWIRHEEASR